MPLRPRLQGETYCFCMATSGGRRGELALYSCLYCIPTIIWIP